MVSQGLFEAHTHPEAGHAVAKVVRRISARIFHRFLLVEQVKATADVNI